MRILHSRILLALFAAASVLAMGSASHASLSGQPAPTPEVTDKIRTEAATILKGEIATGRPDLFLTIQNNAATDFTDLVAKVVGDDTSYNGIVSTLEEAVAAATVGDKKRDDIAYNLAKVHLLRSQLVRSAGERRAPLGAALDVIALFDKNLTDPAASELKGDIHAESGDLDGALAAYREMTEEGVDAAIVRYKSGWAYERTSHLDLAQKFYDAAAAAQRTTGAGGPLQRHLIYQGIARVALARGNDAAALAALAQSAKVDADESAPFVFRLDAARRLLQHGYAREVLAFAKAAVTASPGDADATALRDEASAALRKH